MDKLSIKDFHHFMRGPFAVSMSRAYKQYHIFCEADLQSFAWRKIKNFLERHEEKVGKFRVLNKPYLRDSGGTYPDLVVFRKKVPWVVIELKEARRLTADIANQEREKLLAAKKLLHPRRGYLVYVARYGSKRAITGPKGDGARFFFEVPIVLQRSMDLDEIKRWTVGFRAWSKFVREQD
jgi:hypothetical protein